MSDLTRLIYVSKVDSDTFDSQSIADILRSARKNNPKMHITGMLMFNFDFFLQALEGKRDDVSKLYDIIAKDPRHMEAHTISEELVTERVFEQWAMGFENTGDSAESGEAKSWYDLSKNEALALLKGAAGRMS